MSLGSCLTPAWLRRFAREERGTISVWSLFLFLTAGIIGGFGVDVTQMFAMRTQLQVAADVAAHGALYRRNTGTTTAETAKANAISVAQVTVPEETYGTVIAQSDIVFGTYDQATDVFSADPSSRAAVFVKAEREGDTGNQVGTLLLRLAGVNSMDVGASAVAVTHHPACLAEGFSSNEVVDVQSNNQYFDCFCMHSNAYVSINQNNFFESCTTVSMPDLDDLDIAGSGFERNEGLEEALREDSAPLRILDLLQPTTTYPDGEFWTAFLTPGSAYRPSYVTTNASNITITSNTALYPTNLTPGQVHRYTCNNANRVLTLRAPTNSGTANFANFVLLTNCQIALSGKVNMENVILHTTNTSPTSVTANTSGGDSIYLGADDACAAGRSAKIITRGGFHNSAKLFMYGSQILALGEVNFAAGATGVGASIVADGAIDGTSNMSFTGCGTPGDNFTLPYFRLAR